jgi:hypothetical protein
MNILMTTEKQSNQIIFSFIYIYIYIKEKKISLLCFSVDMRLLFFILEWGMLHVLCNGMF